MADSPVKQNLTAPVTILGRTMTVTRPTDAQVTLMHRWGLITDRTLRQADALQDQALETDDADEQAALEAQAQAPFTEGLKSLAEILDTIGYLFADEDDQAFLVDQMKRGKLTATDLLTVFDPFTKKKATGAGPATRIR